MISDGVLRMRLLQLPLETMRLAHKEISVLQLTTGFSATSMTSRTSHQNSARARRFALHLPVYFRELDSPTWLEGTTENISYTGVLFLSSSPLAPETTLELRLQVAMGTKGRDPAEIRCKGAVVRLEQRNVPETPIALARRDKGLSNCQSTLI